MAVIQLREERGFAAQSFGVVLWKRQFKIRLDGLPLITPIFVVLKKKKKNIHVYLDKVSPS